MLWYDIVQVSGKEKKESVSVNTQIKSSKKEQKHTQKERTSNINDGRFTKIISFWYVIAVADDIVPSEAPYLYLQRYQRIIVVVVDVAVIKI